MKNGFVAQGGILVHDNASTHAHVENSKLQIVLSSICIDHLTLPT